MCVCAAPEQVHKAYAAAVLDIFERNKERFGYAKEEKIVFVSATD